MVSTPEGFTDNIPLSPGPYLFSKNSIARKSLSQFIEVLDIEQNNAARRLSAVKSNYKAITAGRTLWSGIPKRRVHKKLMNV